MKTISEAISEAARDYVVDNFYEHTVWANNTAGAFESGAEWMQKLMQNEMQMKIDELRRQKINLQKEIEKLEQQLIDAGLKKPFEIIEDHSHNA